MDKFLGLPNNIPISLGYSCHPSLLISALGRIESKSYERYVFDWLGSPMWGVCKLIEDNFVDLNSPQYLINKNHYDNKTESYVTNTKYNIIFAHDYQKNLEQITQAVFDATKTKYERRVQRFNEVLSAGVPIIFLRVERDIPGLINFPEDGITEPELFYVKKFSILMKDKGVNCKILFFTSSNPTAWDPVNKICSIHYNHINSNTFLSEKELLDLLAQNQELIKTSFQ
jgi:hypothetical protein